jgi:signal transduction histidine kinase
VQAPDQVWLEIDPIAMGAAIANVVRNALAYSPPGSDVRVTVVSSYEGVTITVRDRGPGVPPHEGQRIFDPFARGGVGAQTRGGKGLGLFIARRVVEAHGGSITLRPVRTGAEFSIELPASVDGRSLSAS